MKMDGSDTHTHTCTLCLTHLHFVTLWLIPFPLCMKNKLSLRPLCCFYNELSDVWAVISYSIHACCHLALPNSAPAGRSSSWWWPASNTIPPSLQQLTYMWSGQLRGGGWKDWIPLFIVPYRQGSAGWEMVIHCVVSPCIIMNSSFQRLEGLRRKAKHSQ